MFSNMMELLTGVWTSLNSWWWCRIIRWVQKQLWMRSNISSRSESKWTERLWSKMWSGPISHRKNISSRWFPLMHSLTIRMIRMIWMLPTASQSMQIRSLSRVVQKTILISPFEWKSESSKRERANTDSDGDVNLRLFCDTVRSVPGSYHIPRKVNSPSAYDWIVHSAPPNSLVTFISMRAAEIVGDRTFCLSTLFS